MFFSLLIKSLVRRKLRKMLSILAVWIGTTLIIGLLTLNFDVGDKMNKELSAFGANIQLKSTTASLPINFLGYELAAEIKPAYLEEANLIKLKTIFWKNNILGFVPCLWAKGKIQGKNVPLLGLWFEQKLFLANRQTFKTGARFVYQHWKIEGAWPSNLNECLVGADLALQLKLSLGQMFSLATEKHSALFRISGIVTTGNLEDKAVILDLLTLQKLTGLTGKISEVNISALTTPETILAKKYRGDPASLTPTEYEQWACTPYPGSIAAQIQNAIPGSAAQVVRRISQSQGIVLTKIKGILFVLVLLALAACTLSVMGILTSAVLERRTEVALLQAIGAHNISVLQLFLAEAGLLGFIGGLLGGGTGLFLGEWLVSKIFGSSADIHYVLFFLSPFFGLLIALLGSAIPVLHTLHQETAEVLHEG